MLFRRKKNRRVRRIRTEKAMLRCPRPYQHYIFEPPPSTGVDVVWACGCGDDLCPSRVFPFDDDKAAAWVQTQKENQ